jgi:hypothetical protein
MFDAQKLLAEVWRKTSHKLGSLHKPCMIDLLSYLKCGIGFKIISLIQYSLVRFYSNYMLFSFSGLVLQLKSFDDILI